MAYLLRVAVQVNDFGADALVSQLLLLDSQAPNKVGLRLSSVSAARFNLL